MIKSITFFFCSLCFFMQGQVFYSVNFSPGHGWTLNTYNNLTTTTEGDSPNIWYVSDNESGMPVGDRGSASCGNPTLHMGSTTIGDGGAAYDAGGCTNLGFGPCASCVSNGLYCVTTDRAATSPAINTVGQTSITLAFNFIHFGTALLDNAQVIYSINGGVSWILLGNLAKATCCASAAACSLPCTVSACNGSRQGQWAAYSSALPASCENITNLMIGIRWYNDDISTNGKDPSVAIDDLNLSVPIILPVTITTFSADYLTKSVSVKWQAENEQLFESFIVEKSPDGISFYEFARIKFCNKNNYSTMDEAPFNPITYYRLKQVDKSQKYQYSKIISVNTNINFEVFNVSFITDTKNILVSLNCFAEGRGSIEVYDLLGKKVINYNGLLKLGENNVLLNAENLSGGIYFVLITSGNNSKTVKMAF